MLSRPIGHLAEVGAFEAREEHELGSAFRFKAGASTFLAFRTAAPGMAAAAQTHREVLLKYGLSEAVLEEFGPMLDEFDTAVTLGNDGRTMHTGATRELSAVASEIAQIVRVMDAGNRQRFQGDGQLLGSWISASTVLGSPRGVSGGGETPVPAPPEGGAPKARMSGPRREPGPVAPEHEGMNRRRWSRLSAAVCLRGRQWAINLVPERAAEDRDATETPPADRSPSLVVSNSRS